MLENRAGPPARIDGLTIGAPLMIREPPHEGEMHPDGDEILVLLSGSVTVVLEDEDPPRRVALAPGRALVVPREERQRLASKRSFASWNRARAAARSQGLSFSDSGSHSLRPSGAKKSPP